MEDCALFAFLKSWVLMASYLCSRFRIFDKLVLEKYISQVEGGPTLTSVMPTCNTKWPSSYS